MAILGSEWIDFFWNKFSFYFRNKDTYINDDGKGIFQRYLEIYGYELEDIEPLWEEYILATRDLDNCGDQYIPLIAEDLGSPPNPLGTLVGLRTLLRYLVTIYKIKGTLESLQILLEILGFNVIIEVEVPQNSQWDFTNSDNSNTDQSLWDDGLLWDDICHTCVNYSILINSNQDDPDNGTYIDISQDDLNDLIDIIEWLEPIDAVLTGINHNIIYCEDVPLSIAEELELTCFDYTLFDEANWDEEIFDNGVECGTFEIPDDNAPDLGDYGPDYSEDYDNGG